MQGSGADVSAGYHGYWITDFTQIDPHLGTNADMKQLISLAHGKGMKVFFDIITNHTADVIRYAEDEYQYRSKADYPFSTRGGPDGKRINEGFAGDGDPSEANWAKLTDPAFAYTPVVPEAEKDIKVPAWLNDPTMYHNRGDSTFAGESSAHGDFAGLDDLWTERPEVVSGMEKIYQRWVRDFDIDGFRIDTVKHVNMEFWQKFSPQVLAAARNAGSKDFFMFGEVFDADPRFMSTYTTQGALQATLDFGFQQNAVAYAKGDPSTKLRDFYANDDYYTDSDSNAYQLPTFLGNHDAGRFSMFVRKNSPNSGAEEQLDRVILGHAMMLTLRGVPTIYYGDEQGFVSDGGDQGAGRDHARQGQQGTGQDPERQAGSTPRVGPRKHPEENHDPLTGIPASGEGAGHPSDKRLQRLGRTWHRSWLLLDFSGINYWDCVTEDTAGGRPQGLVLVGLGDDADRVVTDASLLAHRVYFDDGLGGFAWCESWLGESQQHSDAFAVCNSALPARLQHFSGQFRRSHRIHVHP